MENNDSIKLSKRFLLFIEKRWFQPQGYSNRYKELPKTPGVYILVLVKDMFVSPKERLRGREIVYIGSSKNLFERCSSHEIIRTLKMTFPDGYIGIYFKPLEDNFYEFEKKLIKKLQPSINKTHK